MGAHEVSLVLFGFLTSKTAGLVRVAGEQEWHLLSNKRDMVDDCMQDGGLPAIEAYHSIPIAYGITAK